MDRNSDSSSGRAISRRSALVLGGALAATSAGAAVAHPGTLRFGVFPYLPPLTLDRLFAPVLQSLEAAVHRPVLMRTKATFEEFEAALSVQAYHVAFVHPFFATRAIDGYGYRPLVRLDAPFVLSFVTRAEAEYASPADLHGTTVATPPLLSAATVVATATLADFGLRDGGEVHVDPAPSKLSCIHKVLTGAASACAMPAFAIRQLKMDADPRLRVFYHSKLPIGLSLILRGDIEQPTSARLRDEICSWSQTDDGRRMLEHAGWPGFVPAHHADYAPVRAMLLGLERTLGRS